MGKINPLLDDPACTADDRKFISRTYDLARSAVAHGNEPFGALLVKDGKIILENENSINTSHDLTQHAETGLISKASQQFDAATLAACTLYTSTEPCIMCCGAIRWAGVHRVVYGTTGLQLKRIFALVFPPQPVPAGFKPLQIREVFARTLARTKSDVVIAGPLMEAEGLNIHKSYWSHR